MSFNPQPIPSRTPIVAFDSADKPTWIADETWQRYWRDQGEAMEVRTERIKAAIFEELHAELGLTPLDTQEALSPGLYRVSYYVDIAVPATTSSDVTVEVSWTRLGLPQSDTGTILNSNILGDYESKTVVAHIDGGTFLNISATYNSVGATPMRYTLRVTVERIPS
jgi:hypothetical protein